MGSLILALVASTVLAAFALLRRSVTVAAACLAWVFAVCITYFGGVPAFLALAATLVFAGIAGKIYPSRRKKKDDIGLKHGSRDVVQIICNVFVGTLMLILYGFFEKPAYLAAYGAAMAASLADSMASEIGVLSLRPPADILKRKLVPAGLSGGVTPLGLMASALGAVIIALIFVPASHLGAWGFAVVAGSGFLAAIFDSVLGSAVQAKYRCAKCGSITEKPQHCGEKCAPESGAAVITNDVVNLLNNIFAAAIAVLMFSI